MTYCMFIVMVVVRRCLNKLFDLNCVHSQHIQYRFQNIDRTVTFDT